jgi:hypothetical protein
MQRKPVIRGVSSKSRSTSNAKPERSERPSKPRPGVIRIGSTSGGTRIVTNLVEQQRPPIAARNANTYRGPDRRSTKPPAPKGKPRRRTAPSRPSVPSENLTMTLEGLLTRIRTNLEDPKYLPFSATAAKEIIEVMKGILYPMNIRITYEALACLDRVNKIRQEASETSEIVSRFRILLAANRFKANYNIPLVRQANGIVLEIYEREGKLFCYSLVVPPNDFNPHFEVDDVEHDFNQGKYQIYDIKDGTTLNLYYDPHYIESQTITEEVEGTSPTPKIHKIHKVGAWLRSTKNAFNIDDLTWRGFTYQKVIDDVLKNYPEFNLDRLDRNKVYSIGFKHPAFHPFGQPREWLDSHFVEAAENWIKYAWLIQVYDRSTHTISEASDLGLPLQRPLDIEGLNFAQMLERTRSALDEYRAAKGKCTPFLGYILRTNDPQHSRTSDILLESDLWHSIRHSVYQLPFIANRTIREKQEQNFKSMQYIIIDAFLDLTKRELFSLLFPQFEEKHARLDKLIAQLVNAIYKEMRESKREKRTAPSSIKVENYDETPEMKERRRLDMLLARFLPIVSEQYQLTNSAPSDIKMISTLVRNPKYTEIYLSD